MGHSRRKPTTLGTNLYGLQQLQGLRGAGSTPEGAPEKMSVDERIQLSKSWSAWAPGLKRAIAEALRRELEVKVKRMTLEGWKKHLRNDHLPYYRGCRTCLESQGQSRHHRKIVTPESYHTWDRLSWTFQERNGSVGMWTLHPSWSVHFAYDLRWEAVASKGGRGPCSSLP